MSLFEDFGMALELYKLINREAHRIMASIDTLTTTVQTTVASLTKAIADQAAAITALSSSGASNPALDALTAQLAAANTALAASNAALEAALGTAPGTAAPVPAGLPVSVTAGSAVVTFLTPQTFAKGAAIAFAGVTPQSTIAAATSASLVATLTAPFTGATNASAVTAATTPATGTPPPGTPATTITTPGSFPPGVAVGLTEGSASVTFSSPQDVVSGQSVIFALQPGVSYQWAASATGAMSGTLSSPYNGPSNLSSVTVGPAAPAVRPANVFTRP